MIKKTHFALWGTLLVCLGMLGFLAGSILGLFQVFIFDQTPYRRFLELLIWYSGMPVVVGALLIAFDIFIVVSRKRGQKVIIHAAPVSSQVTVALTAYNDELSIGAAVSDFLGYESVKRVIVISNNSRDRTMEVAREAGALVFNEEKQGYGACVKRALKEAAVFDDTELVVLCEGDMTFRAADIRKFLAYIDHADLVNGTRIAERLQDSNTQVTNFIHYGNFFVAKLLEMKLLGDVTLSDVGTTYKMIRRDALVRVLPRLNDDVNLEFNAHLLERFVEAGCAVVEIPITFYPRVGDSKGASASVWSAVKIGLRMMWGIFFGWKRV